MSEVTVRGKILIQELRRKLRQDVTKNYRMRVWKDFWKDIINVERFKIDKCIGTDSMAKIQIHGFADSSTAALGAPDIRPCDTSE
ncbi:MAG: hypothetical protein EOP45_09260 [Sphingobacteriaceae bacterium]|nr:MAG: hypothetical protein EOP45_09260 [Sphingobacteriaceae bacterium]